MVILLLLSRGKSRQACRSSSMSHSWLTGIIRFRVSLSAAFRETARLGSLSSSAILRIAGTIPLVDMVIFLWESPKPSGSVRSLKDFMTFP